jgi:hypothetical protein
MKIALNVYTNSTFQIVFMLEIRMLEINQLWVWIVNVAMWIAKNVIYKQLCKRIILKLYIHNMIYSSL